MLKVYHKYILKNYLTSFIQVTLIFLSLVCVLNIFEEINFFKDEEVSFLFPLILTFLNSPSILYDIFPFIFLISVQMFFIKIIDRDELTAFKKFGLSNFKILSIIFISVLFLSLIISFFFYNFSAQLKFSYLDVKNKFTKDDKYLAVITDNGLWIKDETEKNINLINALKIENNFLKNVSITSYDKDFNFKSHIQAEEIDVSKFLWRIEKANISEKNKVSYKGENISILTNFNYEIINNLYSDLKSLTVTELYDLKNDYTSLGYSTVEISAHLQKIYSFPILAILLALLGGIFMFRLKKDSNKYFTITFGILISVIVYYINYFFYTIGVNERMPLTPSIWLPQLIMFIILTFSLVTVNENTQKIMDNALRHAEFLN